jgi:O-antigen/teichoic acid export membrane protein
MRVATTLLPPEEMGRLSLITATIGFYALFMVNPVGMFINRRLHRWDTLGRAKYYLKLHWFYLVIVGLLSALSLLILNQFKDIGFQLNISWLIFLVCSSLVFNTINQTAIPSLNLLEFRGWFFTLTLATIATGLICSYLLVLNFAATAEFWLLGLLIGQTVFAGVGTKLFFDRLNPIKPTLFPNKHQLWILFQFAWPIAISVGFNWLQTQGYRLLVFDSLGLVDLGLFVAGYGISAGLMAAFESVLTTYFQPRFYKSVSNDDVHEQTLAWNEYAAAILPSVLLVAFLLVGLAPELTRIMVGPAYQSVSQYVVWGVIAEGSRVVMGVYSLAAHAKMKTSLLILPNMMGAATSIGLIWLLATSMQAHGVGLALSVAGGMMVVGMHYLLVALFGMKLPIRPIYKSLAMGIVLLGITTLGRNGLADIDSLSSALLLITLSGISFLFLFYKLLYPLVFERI